MALEPIKIPQNVYVEDRIIGPVTLKQLMIVAIGAGISYIVWSLFIKFTGSRSIPMTALLWSPTALAAAFAFIKVNDISLFKMILLLIEQTNKAPVRHWEGNGGISINIVTRPPKQTTEPLNQKTLPPSSRLAELSRELESEQRRLAGKAIESNEEHDDEESEDEDLIDASEAQSSTDVRPVNVTRIQAEPLNGKSVDGLGQLHGTLPLR